MPDAPVTAGLPPAPIADDLPCLRCGYNLRGLTADRTCPECGLPVARSLGRRYLHDTPANWLGLVQVGLGLLVFRFAVGAVLLVAWHIAMPLVTRPYARYVFWAQLRGWLGLGVSVVGLVGIVLVTWREPRGVMPRVTPLRVVARALPPVALAGTFLTGVIYGLATRWGLAGHNPGMFYSMVDLVTGVIALAGAVALGLVLREYAKRIPHGTLAWMALAPPAAEALAGAGTWLLRVIVTYRGGSPAATPFLRWPALGLQVVWYAVSIVVVLWFLAAFGQARRKVRAETGVV